MSRWEAEAVGRLHQRLDGWGGARRQPKELTLLVQAGFSPAAAPQSGTRAAAELLRMQADVGTVEPGKFADLVAVQGNPPG